MNPPSLGRHRARRWPSLKFRMVIDFLARRALSANVKAKLNYPIDNSFRNLVEWLGVVKDSD